MRLGSRRLVAEAIVEVLRWQVDLRAPSSAVAFCCSDDLRSRVERLLVIDERNTEPRQTLNLGRLAGGLVLACMTVGWVSWMFPQGGLIVYCLLEHAVGMHCVV